MVLKYRKKGSSMKQLLFLSIMTTTFLFGANYTTYEASSHVGEHATVCGMVSGGYYARRSNGQPTFINLDGRYPHQKFTIFILGKYRHNFSSPERNYNGKNICVTGLITKYKGKAQIKVSDKSQIR
jgi:hypothetical protein